jgi:hypothetical protein
MTSEEVRTLLVYAVQALSRRMLSAPPEAEPATGRIGRLESRQHAKELEDYLRALPASDPRLATIAEALDDPEQLAELIPDDVMVPAEGPRLLDYLAERARARKGEDR